MNWKNFLIIVLLAILPVFSHAQVVPLDMQPEPLLGYAGAPITMIMWADVNEQFSRTFYQNTFHQIKSEYILRGYVKFEFSNLPLGYLPASYPAAMAGECALAQDNTSFWKMLNEFYYSPGSLDRNHFIEFADLLQLDVPSFITCIDTNHFAPEIEDDLLRASQQGVTASPSFFINKIFTIGAHPYSVFQGYLNTEITANQSCNQPAYISNDDPTDFYLTQFNPQIKDRFVYWEEYDLGLTGSRVIFHDIGSDGLVRSFDDVEYELASSITPNTLALGSKNGYAQLAFVDDSGAKVYTCSVPFGCDPNIPAYNMRVIDNSTNMKQNLDIDSNYLVYSQFSLDGQTQSLKFYNYNNSQLLEIQPMLPAQKNTILAKASAALLVWQEDILSNSGRVIGHYFRTYSPTTGNFSILSNRRFGKINNPILADVRAVSSEITQAILHDDLNRVIVADINNATGELISIDRQSVSHSPELQFTYDSVTGEIFAMSGGLITGEPFSVSNYSPATGIVPFAQFPNAINGKYRDFTSWDDELVYAGSSTLVNGIAQNIMMPEVIRIMYLCK